MKSHLSQSLTFTCRQLVIACLLMHCVLPIIASAQEARPEPPPVIAASGSLYSALPASEWTRVESSVDRGLAYLASVQEEDGRFPSDEVAQHSAAPKPPRIASTSGKSARSRRSRSVRAGFGRGSVTLIRCAFLLYIDPCRASTPQTPF